MHKIIFIVLLVAATASTSVGKDKEFKGLITYTIEYSDMDLPEQMRPYLPRMLNMYFRGEMTKTVMTTAGGKTIKIKDGEEKTVITLIDMAGQKLAMKSNMEEIRKELENTPGYRTEFKNETRTIAGYKCKKAVLIPEDDGEWLTVYYTEELGSNVNYFDTPQFSEIPGIMLEFQMSTPQFKMTYTASGVDKKTISKKEFKVPDDFEFKTAEEIQQMFGGN